MSDRKPAPSVSVRDLFVDDRSDILERLDADNPEFVHAFQRHDVDQFTLARNGQEIVKDKDGVVIHHGFDPVVRMSRKLLDAKLRLEQRQSEAVISSMAKNPAKFQRIAKPVEVKELKE